MKILHSINGQTAANRVTSLIRLTKKHLSLISLLLIFASVSNYNIKNKDWNDPIRLIKDDVQYYYIYAVSAVVYHDIKFDRVYSKLPGYAKRDLWLPAHEDTGKHYSKMSMGLSMIYAPFTALAHYVLVPLTGADPNGYSPPYKIGLLISAMAFLLLGLWQLRKLLLEHFSETITALTLLIIVPGTNLTWYISSEATMSHVYSFALVIVMYRLIQKWFLAPSTGNTILLGLVFGLIVLIRPTNIMFLVLFFATDKIQGRMQFLFRNYGKIVLMMVMFLLVWAPQFAFWKYVSGNWFLYTYGRENFFWNNPQIISSMFSFRKGWLVYTPLMLLTFVGLIFLWKQYRPVFWHVLTVLILLIYINSSWWCWWFGGSYGNRAYIDGYGIFALAVGSSLTAVAALRNKILSFSVILILATFICLNLFQTWQYRRGLMHYVGMTREIYCMHFLKSDFDKGFDDAIVMPDHGAGIYGIYYPKTEMTVGKRKLLRGAAETNRPYYLEYFKKTADKDPEFAKLINNHYSLNEKDSISTIWAQEKFNNMRKRL
ncbi:MAG: hypothetical protein V1775_03490 [Bacteroidota bacterium]